MKLGQAVSGNTCPPPANSSTPGTARIANFNNHITGAPRRWRDGTGNGRGILLDDCYAFNGLASKGFKDEFYKL
ncbi:MAG: hypothetical protein R2795_10505 [Saprospiraceae bacterium]